MDIKDIVKKAPDDATHYAIDEFNGRVTYYKDIIPNVTYQFICGNDNVWDENLGNPAYEEVLQLQTRTKVEYVRVTESIFDLKDELHRGELYYTFGDEEWFTFNDEPSLVAGFKEKNIYRRIETPITERDEFIEKVGDIQQVFDKRTNPMWAGRLYDAGCRFVGE